MGKRFATAMMYEKERGGGQLLIPAPARPAVPTASPCLQSRQRISQLHTFKRIFYDNFLHLSVFLSIEWRGGNKGFESRIDG